jgi:hypothetical protein
MRISCELLESRLWLSNHTIIYKRFLIHQRSWKLCLTHKLVSNMNVQFCRQSQRSDSSILTPSRANNYNHLIHNQNCSCLFIWIFHSLRFVFCHIQWQFRKRFTLLVRHSCTIWCQSVMSRQSSTIWSLSCSVTDHSDACCAICWKDWTDDSITVDLFSLHSDEFWRSIKATGRCQTGWRPDTWAKASRLGWPPR